MVKDKAENRTLQYQQTLVSGGINRAFCDASVHAGVSLSPSTSCGLLN